MVLKKFLNKELSGAEFKKHHHGPIFKCFYNDLTHHGFTYKIGKNQDTEPFNPSGSCNKGGLYFTTESEIGQFYEDFGTKIGLISLDDDARVYCEDQKAKANKFNLVRFLEQHEYSVNEEADDEDYLISIHLDPKLPNHNSKLLTQPVQFSRHPRTNDSSQMRTILGF